MEKRIYNRLKEDDLNPYFPGQYQGEIKERYCVIMNRGIVASLGGNKRGKEVYDIFLHVPLASYVKMEEYRQAVKRSLADLLFLKATGVETTIVVDDETKGYICSLEYFIFKDLRGEYR